MVSVDVPRFKGDILAVNDETYGSNLILDDPTAPPPTRPAAASTSTT